MDYTLFCGSPSAQGTGKAQKLDRTIPRPQASEKGQPSTIHPTWTSKVPKIMAYIPQSRSSGAVLRLQVRLLGRYNFQGQPDPLMLMSCHGILQHPLLHHPPSQGKAQLKLPSGLSGPYFGIGVAWLPTKTIHGNGGSSPAWSPSLQGHKSKHAFGRSKKPYIHI